MIGLLMSSNIVFADTNVATNTVSLTVNGSALLAIKTGTAISLSLSGATEAGGAIQTIAADSTTRLRISSLVNGANTRTISAKISALPVGADLILSAQAPTTAFASGASVQGTLLSNVTLATTDRPLITGIGTCWSGTTTDAGYAIKYTYKMQDGATVLTGANVTVTYTLSDPV
jgi:hypothetical protein